MADAIASRGIPFAFVTGHDARDLPESYPSFLSLPKPYTTSDVEWVLAALITETSQES